jgi:hypothetical protein
MAQSRFLGGESVVVVVGNYKVCKWFYEVTCTSACTKGFATHVETRSPPWVTVLGRGPAFSTDAVAVAGSHGGRDSGNATQGID